MSAPVINGQNFPDYVFAEYPKALYPGGDLTGECRIVSGAQEEAEAVAEGYAEPKADDGEPEHAAEPEAPPADLPPPEVVEGGA